MSNPRKIKLGGDFRGILCKCSQGFVNRLILVPDQEEGNRCRRGFEDCREYSKLQVLDILDLVHTNYMDDGCESRGYFWLIYKQAIRDVQDVIIIKKPFIAQTCFI